MKIAMNWIVIMRNMKIQLKDDFDEIIVELTRLEYKHVGRPIDPKIYSWIVADRDGYMLGWTEESKILMDDYYRLTTLSELKEM